MSDLRTSTAELVSRAQGEQIADYLAQLLPNGRPRRVARMFDPGHGDKYRDISKDAPFTHSMLLAHVCGRETWAATLNRGDNSCLGVIEVDVGGRPAVLAVLAAATERGLTAFAIAVDNPLSRHAGGHVWFLYTESAASVAIVAQLRQVATAAGLSADSEIWPCNQVIRLPFGYHRWARTRGELVTQTGELVDLDVDLAGGFDLVRSLPTNAAPPAVSTIVDTPKRVTAVPPRRVSPGELAIERASLDEVRARFNAAHPIEQLLADWGAVPAPGGFSCPCGVPHSHTTTLYISRLGKLFSYSPHCKLYTTKGYDAFGFYVKTQHHDDINAALRTLNPIGARPNPALAPSLPEYVLSPEEKQRRAAEAARKKRARKQQAAETIADVRARSAADTTLTPCDRAVLDTLILIAGDRGWCRPSKERIAELSGYSLGSVKRALFGPDAKEPGRLEGRYFTSEGDGGGPKSTAIRTFLRGSFSAKPADEMIHESIRTCDLIPDSRACERGADPQPDRALLACVRELAGRAAEPGWATRDYAELDDAGLEVEADRLLAVVAAQLADGRSGEIPQMPKSATVADSQVEKSDAGACYDPAADWTAGGVLDLSDWRDPLEPQLRTSSDAIDQAEVLDLTPAPAPAPAARRQYRQPREISAIDRYRVDLAGMEETALAGELKKHQRTLKKHAGAHWLVQIRAKLDLVQAEIDERELATSAGSEAPCLRPAAATRPQTRRRRAALSAEIPRMPTGTQLVLLPIGDKATGFARALVEGSPPLTGS